MPLKTLVRPLRLAVFLLLVGCSGPADQQAPAPEAANPEPAIVAPQIANDDRPLVVFLGDSLTAGYGLDEEQSFPSLIAQRLAAEGREVRVVNAGISGDTTAGGLGRVDWLLSQRPDVLVLALGANDGLRGVDLADSEENLRQIILRARESGAEVLLAGMLIPPNYGPDYGERFAALYPRLAEELGVPRIPFLLEGVAADPELNLADGIHPNAEGQKIVAQTVWRHLSPLLDSLESEDETGDG